jgi:hypothetical protein
MAIAQVFSYIPRPGGVEQFMGIAKKADKILRSLGATTRTLSSVAGAVPNSLLYVIETPSWKAHGELSTKLETDKEWRELVDEVSSNDKPSVDLASSAIYSEIPLG